MRLIIDERVGETYPGAAFGLLRLKDVHNPRRGARLEIRRREIEEELRGCFDGLSRAELKALPPFNAYCAYYKRFNRSYHVLLQVESILKGKDLPSVSALVEAMFLAELRHQLLTAGHDPAALDPPLRLAVAERAEEYTGLGGSGRRTVPGDLLLRDKQGVISSILGGPDHRTRLKEDTRDALFFVYAPPGVGADAIRRHLEEIEDLVQLFAPKSSRESLAVVTAP